VRYMSRSPVSLKRLRFTPGAKEGPTEAPLGKSDPAGVRDRPAGVSSVWSRDASHWLHYQATDILPVNSGS
jgi:hypothetical protein